ncbi:MAG: hypothetical protein ABIZ49_04195 [Opitutaceae bacterium]
MARGHAGASSGEAAAWEILGNLRKGNPVDFAGNFVRLDGGGKRAVVQLLLDLTAGGTGLIELD